MAHEDLGDTTRHARTCGWWEGAPGTEGPAYEREMANRALDGKCTCSLRWRSMVRTEREMHNAWRKRAEDAEGDMLRPVSRALRDDMVLSSEEQSGRLAATFSRQLWNDWAEAIGDLAAPDNNLRSEDVSNPTPEQMNCGRCLYGPPAICTCGTCPADEDDECEHEQFEISWEGRATCEMCGTSWTASQKQIDRQAELRAAAEKEERYWNRVDEGRQRAKDKDI